MGGVSVRTTQTARAIIDLPCFLHVSPANQNAYDNMGQSTTRNSFTAKAKAGFGPWIIEKYKYSIGQINLGSNSISKLEVVSLLNIPNLTVDSFFYNYTNCPEKYNPKVYLGAVQSVASRWNYDGQTGQKTDFSDPQKSGS